MNLHQLSAKDAALGVEVAKLDVIIAEVSGKILTGPVDEISKLVTQRLDLEKQREGLLKVRDDIRNQIRLKQEDAKLEEKAENRKIFSDLERKFANYDLKDQLDHSMHFIDFRNFRGGHFDGPPELWQSMANPEYVRTSWKCDICNMEHVFLLSEIAEFEQAAKREVKQREESQEVAAKKLKVFKDAKERKKK